MNFFAKTLTLLATALLSTSVLAAGSPGVESKTQAFLNAIEASHAKPMEQLSPKDARATLSAMQADASVQMAEASVTEKTIPIGNEKIKIFLVRPTEITETLPAFIFLHGGGWVIGDFPTHERLVRDLVVRSGAAAVFVEYSRAPEARFPIAANQAYAVTKWVAENGKDLGIDGQRLAIVGSSAGGNLAIAVSILAKTNNTPKLRAEVLMWPVTDSNFETASYKEFAEGHYLTRNMMKWFWDNYAPTTQDRKNILASPLKATVEQLKDMPPTLLQVGEKDVLRDEGEAFAQKLQQAGVSVISVRYNGLIHDYGMLNALSSIPAVQLSISQAAQYLRAALK